LLSFIVRGEKKKERSQWQKREEGSSYHFHLYPSRLRKRVRRGRKRTRRGGPPLAAYLFGCSVFSHALGEEELGEGGRKEKSEQRLGDHLRGVLLSSRLKSGTDWEEKGEKGKRRKSRHHLVYSIAARRTGAEKGRKEGCAQGGGRKGKKKRKKEREQHKLMLLPLSLLRPAKGDSKKSLKDGGPGKEKKGKRKEIPTMIPTTFLFLYPSDPSKSPKRS